jgi:hypothetical protein
MIYRILFLDIYTQLKIELPLCAFVGVVTNKPKSLKTACWSEDRTRAA